MDLMQITRRNSIYGSIGQPMPSGAPDSKDRLGDIVKSVNAKKPYKNRWGGKDYPVDVGRYHHFVGALQSLAWVLRDMDFTTTFLTNGGLSYDHDSLLGHSRLFDDSGNMKIVAMVAVSDMGIFRFSRDDKTLRVRKFNNLSQAIAPMRDGQITGTKPINAQTVKELVKIMDSQPKLEPNRESLVRWGRLARSATYKPRATAILASRIKMEFRKFGSKI